MSSIEIVYNSRRIGFSVFLGAVGTYIAVSLLEQFRMSTTKISHKSIWYRYWLLFLASVTFTAVAVWCVHYMTRVSMQYRVNDVPIPLGVSWTTYIVTLVVGVALELAGILLATSDRYYNKSKPEMFEMFISGARNRYSMSELIKMNKLQMVFILCTHDTQRIVAGSFCTSACILFTHFYGVSQMQFQGHIEYNWGLVAACVLIVIIITIPGYLMIFRVLLIFPSLDVLRIVGGALGGVMAGVHFLMHISGKPIYDAMEASPNLDHSIKDGDMATYSICVGTAFSFFVLVYVISDVRDWLTRMSVRIATADMVIAHLSKPHIDNASSSAVAGLRYGATAHPHTTGFRSGHPTEIQLCHDARRYLKRHYNITVLDGDALKVTSALNQKFRLYIDNNWDDTIDNISRSSGSVSGERVVPEPGGVGDFLRELEAIDEELIEEGGVADLPSSGHDGHGRTSVSISHHSSHHSSRRSHHSERSRSSSTHQIAVAGYSHDPPGAATVVGGGAGGGAGTVNSATGGDVGSSSRHISHKRSLESNNPHLVYPSSDHPMGEESGIRSHSDKQTGAGPTKLFGVHLPALPISLSTPMDLNLLGGAFSQKKIGEGGGESLRGSKHNSASNSSNNLVAAAAAVGGSGSGTAWRQEDSHPSRLSSSHTHTHSAKDIQQPPSHSGGGSGKGGSSGNLRNIYVSPRDDTLRDSPPPNNQTFSQQHHKQAWGRTESGSPVKLDDHANAGGNVGDGSPGIASQLSASGTGRSSPGLMIPGSKGASNRALASEPQNNSSSTPSKETPLSSISVNLSKY